MSLDYLVIPEDVVREELLLNTSGASKYSNATIGSNIRTAAQQLERACQRFFIDRPDFTWVGTTEGRAAMFIPGFRKITSVSWQGANLSFAVPPSNTGACWFLPDVQQSGIYTGFQLRVFRNQDLRAPNFLANPLWFDQAADSPYAPWNRGGGVNQHTLPNDLVIVGDAGYAVADYPEPYLDAVKILAAWKTLRPASLLADVVLTPQGSVVHQSDLPAEVVAFIAEWRLGEQAVSVG